MASRKAARPHHPELAVAAAAVLFLSGCSVSGVPADPGTRLSSAPGVLAAVHTPGILVEDAPAGPCHIRTLDAGKGLVLPDPACTPGAVDPAVTQEDIGSTICRAGYTKTVRPPASATDPAKGKALKAYGLPYSQTTEYDHLVPLELGGATATLNLWPEPNTAGATHVQNPKDGIENQLNKAVCQHRVTLAAAQAAIAADWTTALAKLGI